jgi:hypothetical protein
MAAAREQMQRGIWMYLRPTLADYLFNPRRRHNDAMLQTRLNIQHHDERHYERHYDYWRTVFAARV